MISIGRAGRAVAVVLGGSHDGTVIRLASEQDMAVIPQRKMLEVLDQADMIIDPRKQKKLTIREQIRLEVAAAMLAMEAGEDEGDPSDDEKAPNGLVGRRVMATYRAKSKYEYRLDDGQMVILPDIKPERVFIAGKSGAGKSTLTASYMREYQEMFPDRPIYLFSTHEAEFAYEKIEHTVIPLDDEFINNPPTLAFLGGDLVDEERKGAGPLGCLAVFDDCDNLQNKKLMAAVRAVNEDLISNGRKYNIHTVSLNHQLMNHSQTRLQLLEAQRVVFFPDGSQYHNRRFLNVYGGLDGKWIKKILDERSRWICLDNRCPTSYITQSAVVIVSPEALLAASPHQE